MIIFYGFIFLFVPILGEINTSESQNKAIFTFPEFQYKETSKNVSLI